MTITNWIEAGCNTAQWHLTHSQLSTGRTWRMPGSLWHLIRWLSRIRDQLIVRARLRAYVG